MLYSIAPTPIGDLILLGDGVALTGASFPEGRKAPVLDEMYVRDDDAFAEARRQLTAYFAGELKTFDLPLDPHGTAFQKRVWQALLQLPYGTTTTYGQLAVQLGDPKAVRAVGLANGRNPIPVVIPCHRVIGADGSLTGYGGGLHRKQWLLALEGRATGTLWPQ